MRLTTFSDYTLRTLMYLALHPNAYVRIQDMASAFGISTNHLMKVVQHLASTGDVQTLRGPHGGLRLARPPSTIRIGQIIRATEPDLALVPCDTCVIQPACVLPGVLGKAMAAFIAVLDEHTVADLVNDPAALKALLNGPGELKVDRP